MNDPRFYITLMAVIDLLLLVVGGTGLVAAIYDWEALFGTEGRFGKLADRFGRGKLRIAVGLLCGAMVIAALVLMTGEVLVPGELGV